MSLHFHPLAIKEIRKETPDCISVLLDVPRELQEQFRYRQGQSLTLRTVINGEEVRRTYSLCSSPHENSWRIAIKKQDQGLFSSFAHEHFKAGDTLEVMPPVGKFYVELDATHRKNYLAIAAGSGITPVISIIKTTLLSEPGSRFTLVYGNRNRSSIIFFEELEALKNRFMDRFTLVNILSRERTDISIHFGRIDAAKLEELSPLLDYTSFDECFICGPEEMIFSSAAFLENKGISKKKIHFELFASSTPARARKAETNIESGSAGPHCDITLKLDGRMINFQMPLNSDLTLLDAALQQGADLPYACKGGMCCTCKARLVSGDVMMDVHWGLEEEEVEKGFILTCQSHPRTEKVEVDFDSK